MGTKWFGWITARLAAPRRVEGSDLLRVHQLFPNLTVGLVSSSLKSRNKCVLSWGGKAV